MIAYLQVEIDVFFESFWNALVMVCMFYFGKVCAFDDHLLNDILLLFACVQYFIRFHILCVCQQILIQLIFAYRIHLFGRFETWRTNIGTHTDHLHNQCTFVVSDHLDHNLCYYSKTPTGKQSG